MQEKPELKRSTGLWMAARRFATDMTIAALAFAYSVWAITGSGRDTIAKGFVLLLAGIPVYVFVKWREGRRRTGEAGGFELPPPVVDEMVVYKHGDELQPAGSAR